MKSSLLCVGLRLCLSSGVPRMPPPTESCATRVLTGIKKAPAFQNFDGTYSTILFFYIYLRRKDCLTTLKRCPAPFNSETAFNGIALIYNFSFQMVNSFSFQLTLRNFSRLLLCLTVCKLMFRWNLYLWYCLVGTAVQSSQSTGEAETRLPRLLIQDFIKIKKRC